MDKIYTDKLYWVKCRKFTETKVVKKQPKIIVKCFKVFVLFVERKSLSLWKQVLKQVVVVLSTTQSTVFHLRCICLVTHLLVQEQSWTKDWILMAPGKNGQSLLTEWTWVHTTTTYVIEIIQTLKHATNNVTERCLKSLTEFAIQHSEKEWNEELFLKLLEQTSASRWE